VKEIQNYSRALAHCAKSAQEKRAKAQLEREITVNLEGKQKIAKHDLIQNIITASQSDPSRIVTNIESVDVAGAPYRSSPFFFVTAMTCLTAE
jgi:hypothetical protein